MNGSVCGVVGQFGQVHRLKDNTLTAESGITVNQHRHDTFAFTITAVELFGTCFSLHNWITGFQMRWIGNNGQTNIFVCDTVQTFDVRSQMVFDITGTIIGRFQTSKLRENVMQWFTTNICLKLNNLSKTK